jgi:cysteine-rich repeat protein
MQDKADVTNAISMSGQPVCGNGIVERGETCDDRNNADGDGCDSNCQVEKGYTCSRMPSQCVKTAPNIPNSPPAPAKSTPPTSPSPTPSTEFSTTNPTAKN